MSKRLNRRQQRLKEEEQASQMVHAASPSTEPEEDDDDDEEEAGQNTSQAGNLFESLQVAEDEDEAEEESEEETYVAVTTKKSSSKKKKKKKKPAVQADSLRDESPSLKSDLTKKKGAGGGGESTEFGMDELDRALAEIKQKYPEASSSSSTAAAADKKPAENSSAMAMRSLLSVDLKNLDADEELRRFFGRKVVNSAQSSAPGSNRKNKIIIRTHLSKPKPNWPPPTSLLGLGMRLYTDSERDEKYNRMIRKGKKVEREWDWEKWFTFEHSFEWREAQRQFLGSLGSHDPNQLFALLQVYPYHTDTLLQVSSIYHQQNDLTLASDFIDRSLFCFERSFAPGFNIANGNVRLDFDRCENRGFFLNLHRNLQFLGRRGCWSTSFEFSKLLFSLDPHTDPHGSLLWIDFLAVKAGKGDWLLSFLDEFDDVEGRYPGMKWGKVLAVRQGEEKDKKSTGEESLAALKDAVATYPYVLPFLADKVGISLPSEIREHALAQPPVQHFDPYNPGTSVLHLLSFIYALRSSALWKESTTLAWLQDSLPLCLNSLIKPSSARTEAIQHWKLGPSEGIVRHCIASENNTSLLSFLDPMTLEGQGMQYDPLPPTTAVSFYDKEYFAGFMGRNGKRRREGGHAGLDGADEAVDAAGQIGYLQSLFDSLQRMVEVDSEEEPAGGGGFLGGIGARLREIFARGEVQTDVGREQILQEIMALQQEDEDEEGEVPMEDHHVPGGFQ